MSALRMIKIPTATGEGYLFPAFKIEAPHEEWEFVLHKSVAFDSYWVVAELSTGFAIVTTMECIDDPEDAEVLAVEKLLKKSRDEVAGAIERAREIIQQRAAVRTLVTTE